MTTDQQTTSQANNLAGRGYIRAQRKGTHHRSLHCDRQTVESSYRTRRGRTRARSGRAATQASLLVTLVVQATLVYCVGSILEVANHAKVLRPKSVISEMVHSSGKDARRRSNSASDRGYTRVHAGTRRSRGSGHESQGHDPCQVRIRLLATSAFVERTN